MGKKKPQIKDASDKCLVGNCSEDTLAGTPRPAIIRLAPPQKKTCQEKPVSKILSGKTGGILLVKKGIRHPKQKLPHFILYSKTQPAVLYEEFFERTPARKTLKGKHPTTLLSAKAEYNTPAPKAPVPGTQSRVGSPGRRNKIKEKRDLKTRLLPGKWFLQKC